MAKCVAFRSPGCLLLPSARPCPAPPGLACSPLPVPITELVGGRVLALLVFNSFMTIESTFLVITYMPVTAKHNFQGVKLKLQSAPLRNISLLEGALLVQMIRWLTLGTVTATYIFLYISMFVIINTENTNNCPPKQQMKVAETPKYNSCQLTKKPNAVKRKRERLFLLQLLSFPFLRPDDWSSLNNIMGEKLQWKKKINTAIRQLSVISELLC